MLKQEFFDKDIRTWKLKDGEIYFDGRESFTYIGELANKIMNVVNTVERKQKVQESMKVAYRIAFFDKLPID